MKKINLQIGIIVSGICLFLAGCGDDNAKAYDSFANAIKVDKNLIDPYTRAKIEKYIKIRKSSKEKGYPNNINWVEYLIFFPQDAKECEKVGGFQRFTSFDWLNLLSARPCFEKQLDKFGNLGRFSPSDWCTLIMTENDFLIKKANELDIWKTFSEIEWFNLIYNMHHRPYNSKLREICYYHNTVKKISLQEWANRIAYDEEFFLYLKYLGFGQFNYKDWEEAAKKAKDSSELKRLERLETKLKSAWEEEGLFETSN